MARGLKFCIQEVEGLYYLCSENKGADQLRVYREADLRLCFRICKKPVFSRRGSYECELSMWISCEKDTASLTDRTLRLYIILNKCQGNMI